MTDRLERLSPPSRFKACLIRAAALAFVTLLPGLGLAEDEEAAAEDKTAWAIIPGAFYSQETTLGFAVFGTYTFPLPGSGPNTRPSNVRSAIVYTLRNQASWSLWSSFYLGEENDWAIETEAFVEHFPNWYFGLGRDSEDSHQVFTRRQLYLDNLVLRQVRPNFYLGGSHNLALIKIIKVEAPVSADGESEAVWSRDDQLGSGNVVGADGSLSNGLGALARWDTRDNVQSTRTGALVDLELAAYPTALGSSSGYFQTTLDLRGFVPIGKGTLAAQWITEIGVGELPFTAMAELGGDNMLRGMFQGRFRDQSLTAAQLELRHPLIWRFGVAAFAGVGHVFHQPGELFDAPPRWTAGGGLRFEIDEQTHDVIRLDLAGGPDGFGMIFTFGEAF